MKKNFVLLLSVSLCFCNSLFAQIKLGNNPTTIGASSLLEMESTNKGLVLPRMTTAQIMAIESPLQGMLVYNTDSNGIAQRTSTAWQYLCQTGGPNSPTSNDWHINGNSGTMDGTNFLGTTDNVPLNFRLNNQKAGRIDNTNANAFFGYLAGNNNTSGTQNTFVGQQAGFNNTTGVWNTFVGDSAGYSNTSGFRNTGIGYKSLLNNTTGWWNDAFGYKTLYSNTTGSDNMAVGHAVLFSNTTGIHNVGVGNDAIVSNTTGGGNSVVGYGALYFNNDPIGYNTAMGYNAMWASTIGSFNTAIGRSSLTNTTGTYNTALGDNSGGNNTSGSNNTFIGSSADASVNSLTNATAIGYQASVSANNTMVLGNNSITALKCNVQTITALSDGRFKTDIRKDVPGLDFILKLTPVTYHLDVHKLNAYTRNAGNASSALPVNYNPSEEAAIRNKESIEYSGFIAQDVEKAAEKVGYNFSGVYKPQNSKDTWGLGYSEFVVPLVKAVQEQQDQIKQLNNQVDAQNKAISELKEMVKQLSEEVKLKNKSKTSE